MREIKDKYTGKTFSSIQEYDVFRRASEYQSIRKEYLNRWVNEFVCIYDNMVFNTLEELKEHYKTYHGDKIEQINMEMSKKMRRMI